ncbi:hypothetical protein MRBLMI12_003795 [Microbacterium sp. LMI12-1-1.1]|uniref:endonuclease domain-containing protein n=1 Tax=Microbacterium sp. LMI12-1-1.1 TaxID=3135225 RepID=UPI0034282FC0
MPAIDGPAFRVGDALRAGMPRRAVDADTLDRPFTGLRAHPEDDRDQEGGHPLEVARDAHRRAARQFTAHMHPHEFFSHATAALLWDLPMPAVADRIDVSVIAPHRAPSGRGVRGHQLAGPQVTTTPHAEGFAITSPASTWAQLGATVKHPYDLTAIADAVIRTPRIPGPQGRVLRAAHSTVADLVVELGRGRRIGIRELEEAVRRTRPGAASRPETWTRLTLVDAGLPEPTLDHDVYDERGVFVGCVDLAYIALKIAIEYEGDHHRVDAAQWARDIQKHDRLAELGWRVIRVTRADVFEHPGELVVRVRGALRSRS